MAGRVLLIICDGLGDRPVPSLGGKTPLQAARTPNLDALAKGGATGLLDVIGPGIRPGSDTAHLALFGYDPHAVYAGRGPFEAAGVGLTLEPGDIAFRCNFATVDDAGRVLDRRAGRIREGTADLAQAVGTRTVEGVEFQFREGTEHRGALRLRGDGLDPRVSDGDPHREGEPLPRVEALVPEAKRTAQALNAFLVEAREALATHPVNRRRVEEGQPPANALLTRGGGVLAPLTPVTVRWGLQFGAIAGVALIKGICRVTGMEVVTVEGATGGLDADLRAKIRAAVKALETYEVVVLNVKAPDIAGHDRKPDLKVEVIERLDRSLGSLRDSFQKEWLFSLTADHSTPCTTGEHSGDPVPLVVFGEAVRPDQVKRFDEASVASGGLGRLRGIDLLPLLLDLADRTEKFGA